MFPAHAGMILKFKTQLAVKEDVPRTRGDDPIQVQGTMSGT